MKEESPDTQESPEITQIRQDLTEWLASDDWNTDQLSNWILGYNFFTYNEEPCFRLERALKGRQEISAKFADRITEFLRNEKLVDNSLEPYDDQFFFNLFYLSSRLRTRGKLGSKLEKLYEYFLSNPDVNDGFFESKRYSLRSTFTEAIVANQISNRFRDVWIGLMNGDEYDSVLTTVDTYSGFRGIVLSPNNGEIVPNLEDIGFALKQHATSLSRTKNRGMKFRQLLDYVKESWSECEAWNRMFIELAIKFDFPDWAICKFDSLVQEKAPGVKGYTLYYVWEVYIPFLRALELPFRQITQNGIIFEIEASKEAILFLNKTSPTVENIRRLCPFEKYRSIEGAANQGFMEVEEFFRSIGEDEFASKVMEVRRLVNLAVQRRKKVSKTIKQISDSANDNLTTESFEKFPELFIQLLQILKPKPKDYEHWAYESPFR